MKQKTLFVAATAAEAKAAAAKVTPATPASVIEACALIADQYDQGPGDDTPMGPVMEAQVAMAQTIAQQIRALAKSAFPQFLAYEDGEFNGPAGAIEEAQNRTATQDWVNRLTIMQQSVLLGAVRGPDGIGKYHPAKYLLRWYRRCILISAIDGAVLATPYAFGGGSFTGPSYGHGTSLEHDWRQQMDAEVSKYLQCLDELPHHFQLHFMHAVEILGFKHPDETIRTWWHGVYLRLVHDLHLWPETEEQLDARLGDNREGWLARSDAATSS